MIIRNPAEAEARRHDLIIIGGGIYGAMLALEATLRGLKPLLLERDDFGAHTSFNSLRIIHGGLRYLQSLDLQRFFDSVAERSWFMKTFPEIVKPLPFMMSLYGRGLHRPIILRLALWANTLFSAIPDRKTPVAHRLPAGEVLDSRQCQRIFPGVRKTDLKGAAVWYDAIMTDSQRLLLEVIKWACSNGATALNYMTAEKLVATNGAVNGLTATDKDSRQSFSFQAPKVINAAGPWCRQLAGAFDRDIPRLFRPSLAFNTLFDRPAVSSHGLAIAPPTPDGRTYFLLPWKGKLLAGTGHAAWKDNSGKPEPTEEQLADFLNDLNSAAPGLNFSIEEIVCTFAGLLPVKKDSGTDLTKRPVWIDHGKRGGPHGLYSVSGIKFTTARQVADRLLCRIYPQHQKSGQRSRERIVNCQNGDPNCTQMKMATGFEKGVDHLKTLIAGESVRHLDDLVFRRTDLWENPIAALRMAPRMAGLFEWTDARRNKEIEQLVRNLPRPVRLHFTKQ